MNKIYEYATIVANRLKKLPVTAGKPYMDLAADIKADIDIRRPDYCSEEEFLAYVWNRMRGRNMELAYRDFVRNYRAWLRRHK